MNTRTHSMHRRRWSLSGVFALACLFLGFLLLPAFIYSDSGPKRINAFNGSDWLSWSYQTQYTFLLGFFVGSYTVQQGAGNLGYLTYEQVEQLQFALPRHTTVDAVLMEITAFYASEDHAIPLTVGIILRNERALGPWSKLSKRMHGWGYEVQP
jgi:hypothetical protein